MKNPRRVAAAAGMAAVFGVAVAAPAFAWENTFTTTGSNIRLPDHSLSSGSHFVHGGVNNNCSGTVTVHWRRTVSGAPDPLIDQVSGAACNVEYYGNYKSVSSGTYHVDVDYGISGKTGWAGVE